MLLPTRWLRRKWQFMTVYWIVQAVVAYFFALTIMSPWEADGNVLMWLAPLILTGTILTLQWAFLSPIRRPAVKAKGLPIMVSLAVGGLFIALLVAALVLAISHVLQVHDLLDLEDPIFALICVLAAAWVVSTLLLIAFCRRGRREAILQRVASGIFLGTIVEAAAIMPLDMLIRRREECICRTGTFFALAICGSIGILVFGPAIFLPFVLRYRKRWYGRRCDACGYDMRGNMKADRCPECGAGWRTEAVE